MSKTKWKNLKISTRFSCNHRYLSTGYLLLSLYLLIYLNQVSTPMPLYPLIDVNQLSTPMPQYPLIYISKTGIYSYASIPNYICQQGIYSYASRYNTRPFASRLLWMNHSLRKVDSGLHGLLSTERHRLLRKFEANIQKISIVLAKFSCLFFVH